MDVIDGLYEAALVPENWNPALKGLCDLTQTRQGVMLLMDRASSPRLAGHGIPPLENVEVFNSIWRDSPGVRWCLTERPSSFVPLSEHLPDEVRLTDRALTMPHNPGGHDNAVCVQPLGAGRHLAFSFAKMASAGPFTASDLDRLNAMRPHLIRAGLVAQRLGLERARSIVDALARMGLAAAVIGTTGKAIAVNELLEAMPTVLRPTAFGGIAIADRIADDRFRAALARAGAGADGPQLSIPVRGNDLQSPLIIHLVPVRGAAQDVFSGGHVLMIVTPVGRRKAPTPELLFGLFDLTPAEARLTRELLAGGGLPEIAARTGLSHHTLRIQLRSILAKTGVGRQAELTQLLAAL